MYSADAREGFKVLAWRHSRIRSHAGTPKHVNIFGYFYDIDTGVLNEVVNDKAAASPDVIGFRLSDRR